MKVLLLRDISKVGHKGEVKEVSEGYAHNFLIRQGLARAATPDVVREAALRNSNRDAAEAAREQALQAHIASLMGKRISIKAKADKSDHLFKKIRREDIAVSLQHALGVAIPESVLSLEEPLATLGTHDITLSHGGKQVSLQLVVEREV